MTQHASSTPEAAAPTPLPAAGDWVVAWPQEPQQLFVLLHGAGQQPADWQALAQTLAQHFPQGLVAVLATPAAVLQSASAMPAAVAALQAVLQRWQAHTGLNFARTALVAQGVAASVALQAAMQEADICARLFAVGGHLPEQATPLSEQTSLHWLHGDADMPADQARALGQRLQTLDVDFTLDVLVQTTSTADTPALQQRIVHLLQNHVPRRLWREALASASMQDALAPCADDDTPPLH